jgi:hypothetical protein
MVGVAYAVAMVGVAYAVAMGSCLTMLLPWGVVSLSVYFCIAQLELRRGNNLLAFMPTGGGGTPSIHSINIAYY